MKVKFLILLLGIVLFSMSGVLAFDTYINNSNIFVDGNVGIGTDSPSWLLEVSGSVNLNNSFYVNSSTGFVGIGTSSPGRKLHVYAGDSGVTSWSGTDFILEDSSTPTISILGDTGNVGRIFFGDNDSSLIGGMEYFHNSNNSLDQFAFKIGGVYPLRIYGSGNVGIGVDNPSYPLEIFDEDSTTQLQVSGGCDEHAGTASGQIKVGSSDTARGIIQYDAAIGDFYIDNIFNADAGDIHFRTKTSGTAVNAMTITGAGNVGIGTSNPTAPLYINKTYGTNGDVQPMIVVEQGANGDEVIGLYGHSIGGTGDTVGSVAFNLRMTDGLTHIYVESDGNLEISSSATAVRGGTGTVVGTQTSSLDTKNIISQETDTENALQLVLDTSIYNFKYKSGGYNNHTFTGIIADYSPEFAMDTDEAHPFGKSFNPVNSVGYLILAIQELKVEKDSEILKLETEIDLMKVALCELEKEEFC